MLMKSSQVALEEIERVTLDHYESNAESFWQGTKDHDVSQNIAAFLQALPQDAALELLDFGCGPGRDLYTFKSLGHRPTGLDGSEAFCRMAHQYSGCPTLHQQFLHLDLGEKQFDGSFANASLFHVPSQELPRVLAIRRAATGGYFIFVESERQFGRLARSALWPLHGIRQQQSLPGASRF